MKKVKTKVEIIESNWNTGAKEFSNLLFNENKWIEKIKAHQYGAETSFVIKFTENCSKENARDIIFTCLKNVKAEFVYSVKFYGG